MLKYLDILGIRNRKMTLREIGAIFSACVYFYLIFPVLYSFVFDIFWVRAILDGALTYQSNIKPIYGFVEFKHIHFLFLYLTIFAFVWAFSFRLSQGLYRLLRSKEPQHE